MSTIRPWAVWRRIQYTIGFFIFCGLVSTSVYYGFFYQPGNCFDAVMNEDETGTDCGGKCVRICAASTIPPSIVWADSFKVVEGQYNAVAYIENKNGVASTPTLNYTFQLFNGNELVAERKGTTVLPPNSQYPIFEGRITTNGKPVTNTKLTLEPVEMWLPAQIGREQFRTSNLDLSGVDSKPRLSVNIENTELTKAEKVEVVATLFNDSGKAVTASQTFIEALNGRESKNIIFTWPNPIAKTVRSCSIPSDVVIGIDLSGSMDSDGGTPPQPVTDALTAAKNFAGRLSDNDQAAIVTFASTATTNAPLTKNRTEITQLIQSLSISTEAQTGYTNTPAAFLTAQAELASERHNGDARRALVLLTDGLPTAKGDTTKIVEEAKQAAKDLSTSGAEVYVIGLGKNVDQEFIKSLVDDSANAFYAPTSNDLEGIYNKITGALCESGTARIDVIAKTPTNFAPLW